MVNKTNLKGFSGQHSSKTTALLTCNGKIFILPDILEGS